MTCGHLLCELIGLPCSLDVVRSRGCRPNLTTKVIADSVFDEVQALVGAIKLDLRDEGTRSAAVRLAAIIRREALDGRHVMAQARSEELEFAEALERLCGRRR